MATAKTTSTWPHRKIIRHRKIPGNPSPISNMLCSYSKHIRNYEIYSKTPVNDPRPHLPWLSRICLSYPHLSPPSLCLHPTTPQFIPGLCSLLVYPSSMHAFFMLLSSQILSSSMKLRRCPSSLRTPYSRSSYTFFMTPPWPRTITSSLPPWTYLLSMAFRWDSHLLTSLNVQWLKQLSQCLHVLH